MSIINGVYSFHLSDKSDLSDSSVCPNSAYLNLQLETFGQMDVFNETFLKHYTFRTMGNMLLIST